MSAGPPSLQAGRDAARGGRFETARRAFEAAADHGDAEGFYELGLLHWHGHGVPQSREKAVALFKLAAEGGHMEAQHQLALALFPSDRPLAERWLVSAAEAGCAPAMTRLAELFGKRDPVAARGLLARAADHGHPPAMIGYGHVLAGGVGGELDRAEGVAWLYAALALTGDCDVQRDIRALARILPAHDIATAQRKGRALAKRFRDGG